MECNTSIQKTTTTTTKNGMQDVFSYVDSDFEACGDEGCFSHGEVT